MAKWHGKGKNRWRYVKLKKAPYGSYDLGLDQSVRASRRGLGDLVADIAPYVPGSKTPAGTQALRGLEDVLLARKDIGRQRGYLSEDYATGVGDVNRNYSRTLEDLLGQENMLKRNYAQLGNVQRQNFQAGGVAEGGAVEQAAQKRAANYAIEEAPITTARSRAGVDRQLSLDDLLRQQTRSASQLDTSLGEVNLTYGRGAQDRATQLARARREADQFKTDIAQTKMQQYLQTGGQRKIKVGRKRYRKLAKQGVI